ncbi:hypothetical protein Ahy_B04g070050 isoform A [Arachis hypogaea]|uniref:Aminotransferase-like plant mobile domain-containing protein n=1 Tax=Arachis hypogaea TaxID=3818 RepID=A0A444ZEL9_ARAHY|nr:hypothetical protein Ahy_B04g070050 isoform A [Arachis hypogaea]
MTLRSFEALEAECTILFGDKSGASVHWKFLPLLSDFASIGQYSWGSACLAHLYRSLCRASRFDCKEIDGPLTLLLCWAWMRLPYLAPVPREPRSFPLANRWRNWDRGDRVCRYLKLAHFRKALDDLQEGQFLWVAYSVDRVDPDIIPVDIYLHSVIWSATVLLWTNRYNHVLTEEPMAPQQPLDTYMYWYRSKYGYHLNLSDLVVQEDVEGDQVMDDENEEQEPQSPPPPPQSPPLPPSPPPPPPPEEQRHSTSQYVPQTQFTTSFPIHQQHWVMSQFDSGDGGSFS